MAKKKPKKPVKKSVAKAAPAAKPKPAPPPTILVLYELRDQAGMVRYHSEHADPERARLAARTLVSTPDISQAWVLRDVEIMRAGS